MLCDDCRFIRLMLILITPRQRRAADMRDMPRQRQRSGECRRLYATSFYYRARCQITMPLTMSPLRDVLCRLLRAAAPLRACATAR